jgi:serine/threonine protein kinase
MCEETKNYLWATQDILGHGATSQVYKAYNKTTGELVAAKVYQVSSNLRSPYGGGNQNYAREKDFRPILDREMDILKAANDENIVRYIALEQVISSDSAPSLGSREALLIEYCNGGSLHNVLELPENRYGLMEDEFMLVFKHLTSALRYLHDKNTVRKIIHFRVSGFEY